MDYLKEGIGLRAMAQRDPLIEYQREGFEMFNNMLDALKEEIVGFLFNLQVEAAEPEPVAPPMPVSISNGAGPLTGSRARARAAAAADQGPRQPEAPAGPALAQLSSGSAIPPALRGKGLDEPGKQRLSYSGPAENGETDEHDDADGAEGEGTRKERRAAARAQAKSARKGPRR
jgi:preprotein translocase subunit SecA